MTGFTPTPSSTNTSNQRFIGKAHILGPQWSHLPTLTIGLLGVQIFWSVEMSYASPYLISLGLSKSAMSLVFLAGPLSGLIMQPVIGVLADTTASRFGRRRPWMMLGTLICVAAMLLLGYTRPFAAIFTGWNTASNNHLTVALAVLSIYLIDFSINAVMAMDRALIVDTLPSSAQSSGNAWAARMLGFGAVVGFLAGSIPLTSIFPFLGSTQLEVLSFVVSVLLLAGHILMGFCVKERILLKDTHAEYSAKKKPNVIVQEIRNLWTNVKSLPKNIRQICIIQFFAWIGWFPILFYSTLYIGDVYKKNSSISSTPTQAEQEAHNAEATRLGTRALFFSSLIALFLNLVLPFCVATPASRHFDTEGSSRGFRHHTSAPWWEFKVPERYKVNLASLWAISHLVVAICMFGTLLTDSVGGATFWISLTGFSWAITQWAPFSLLGEAILTTPDPNAFESEQIQLSDARTPSQVNVMEEREGLLSTGGGKQFQISDDGSDEESEDEGHHHPSVSRRTADGIFGNAAARASHTQLGEHERDWEPVEAVEATSVGARNDDDMEAGEAGDSSHNPSGGLSAKAGIILGIHNVFIVIPQFIVTGISAIVFAIFEPFQPQAHVLPIPPKTTAETAAANVAERAVQMVRSADARGSHQSNSVVYIFGLGGIAALVAFVLCWRLARDMRHR